jgi:hypothetical protein
VLSHRAWERTSRPRLTNTRGDDDAGGPGAAGGAGGTPVAPGPSRLSGLLAGAAGLVVAELVGRVVPGGSSPVLAVANRVVDLTPTALRGPAIEATGNADKPLLLAGILLVVGLLAAYGGGLAARRPGAAEALIGGLAVVVLLAQLPEPDSGVLGAAAVAAVLAVVATLVLRMLVRLAPATATRPAAGASSPAPPPWASPSSAPAGCCATSPSAPTSAPCARRCACRHRSARHPATWPRPTCGCAGSRP